MKEIEDSRIVVWDVCPYCGEYFPEIDLYYHVSSCEHNTRSKLNCKWRD